MKKLLTILFTMLLFVLKSFSAPDPNLKLRFDFDEDFSGGSITDVSGNGNTGTQFNSTNLLTTTNGVFGGTAANFVYVGNMTNDPPNNYPMSQYIAVTNLNGIEYLTNATISFWAWFKSASKTNQINLLDCGYNVANTANPSVSSNSFSIQVDNYGNHLYFRTYPGAGSYVDSVDWPGDLSSTDTTTNYNLYTVTIDCPGNKIISYYNGQPCMTNAINLPWLHIYGCATQRWLCVGAMSHNGTPQWGDDKYPNSGFFFGALDDLRIYNRTLSATEVQALNAGTNVNDSVSTYYVATTGNDSNAGSVGSPWLTIQHAASTATSGSTVLVNNGAYNERPVIRTNNTVFLANGSAVKVLQGFDLAGTNITIDGFDTSWTNGTLYQGVFNIGSSSSNIVVQNCYIHDSPYDTAAIQMPPVTYATNGPFNCTFSNNVQNNCSSIFGTVQLFGMGHLVVNNVFENNPMDLFHLFGANHIIRGNYVTNIYDSTVVGGHVDLFQTFGNNGFESYNMLIDGNTFVNCNNDGMGANGGCSICQLNDRDFTTAGINATKVMIPAHGLETFEYSLGVTNGSVTTHLSASAPVTFIFNQSYFAGRGWPGDTNLATGVTSYSGVMQCPPLLGSKCYYLAVTNPNPTSVTVSVWVDCSNPLNLTMGNILDGTTNLLRAIRKANIHDWTFRNNIFDHIANQASIGIPNCDWYNNLFYYTTTNTSHCLNYAASFQSLDATNGHVFNNIFYACGQDPANKQFGWYADGISAPGIVTNTYDYNLVIGTGAGTVKKTGARSTFTWQELHGLNGVDPLLVNPAAQDYHLSSSSPAIGAGTNLSALFTDDFNGQQRPLLSGNWNIGPLEVGPGQPHVLSPPTGLRVHQ